MTIRIRIVGLGLVVTLRVVETARGYVWADEYGFVWCKGADGHWSAGELAGLRAPSQASEAEP